MAGYSGTGMGGPGGGGGWASEKDIVVKNKTVYQNIVEQITNKPYIQEFNILEWIKNNWQLSVIGLVAFLILLKD